MKKSAGLSENDNFKLSMKINNGLTTLLLSNFFFILFFVITGKIIQKKLSSEKLLRKLSENIEIQFYLFEFIDEDFLLGFFGPLGNCPVVRLMNNFMYFKMAKFINNLKKPLNPPLNKKIFLNNLLNFISSNLLTNFIVKKYRRFVFS